MSVLLPPRFRLPSERKAMWKAFEAVCKDEDQSRRMRGLVRERTVPLAITLTLVSIAAICASVATIILTLR